MTQPNALSELLSRVYKASQGRFVFNQGLSGWAVTDTLANEAVPGFRTIPRAFVEALHTAMEEAIVSAFESGRAAGTPPKVNDFVVVPYTVQSPDGRGQVEQMAVFSVADVVAIAPMDASPSGAAMEQRTYVALRSGQSVVLAGSTVAWARRIFPSIPAR